MMNKKTRIVIAVILMALGIAGRVLEHPFNFAPISAMAIFAGVYLGWRYAIIMPLLTMAIGDIFIGFYELPMMLVVYASFAFAGCLGLAIKKYKSVETVIGASLASSIVFFLSTNWAVWQFSPWYTRDWSGLVQCFTNALPFFRNTLVGDLFWVSLLFGIYEVVKFGIKSKKAKALMVNLKNV